MKMRFGARFDVVEYFAHVVAGGEIPAGAAQNHETDGAGFARDRIEMIVQSFEYFLGQGIELLGTIQRQDRCAGVIVPSDQIAHIVAP